SNARAAARRSRSSSARRSRSSAASAPRWSMCRKASAVRLQHYAQDQAVREPQIALGTIGQFAFGAKQVQPWQIVGYVERCEVPEDPDDEQVFWREYLLYDRTEGLSFLVDAEDAWD